MKIINYLHTIDLPSHIPYAEVSPERFAGQPGEAKVQASMAAFRGAQVRNQAGQEMAGALRYVGQELGKYVEEKRNIDESLDAAHLFNEARQRIHLAEIELSKNPDENTHVQKVTEAIGKVRSDVLGKAKSKNVQVALDKAIDNLGADRINTAGDFAFGVGLVKSKGKLAQEMFDYEQAFMATPDPSERVRIRGEAKALAQSVATRLGLDPDELMRKWDQGAVTGAVKTDAIANPAATKEKIIAGKYPGLWEEAKPALIRMCEELEISQQARQDKIVVDTEGKRLLDYFQQPSGRHDFESINQLLGDANYLKEHNITLTQAHAIGTMLSMYQQNEHRAKQMEYHKTDQSLVTEAVNGTITPQNISSLVADDKLDGERGKIWLSYVNEAAKLKANPVTDFPTYARINTAIRLKQVNLRGGMALIASNVDKLAEGDRKTLLNSLLTEHTQEMADGYKIGLGIIEGQLLPKRGITAPLQRTPYEEQNCTEAQQMLDIWLDGEQKAGRVPTSIDIQKKAQEITNLKRKTFAELTADMTQYMKELSGGGPARPTAYVVGQTYSNAEGEQARYLGPGKWERVGPTR